MRLIARGQNKTQKESDVHLKESTVHLKKMKKVYDVGKRKICDDHAYTMASYLASECISS
jgi:hypothetical protein